MAVAETDFEYPVSGRERPVTGGNVRSIVAIHPLGQGKAYGALGLAELPGALGRRQVLEVGHVVTELRRPCAQPLPSLALQERQRLAVEFGDVLVDRGVGAALEDHQLASRDAALHRLREAGRGDDVVATEGDLRR